MEYDLAEFEKMVEEGYVRKVTKGDLVLYNYTDKATYDRKWDTKYIRDARGIIFEATTGRLVAKPFSKFFNLGEMEETQLLNLPTSKYEVLEKLDGSLGILYFYNDEWHMATRGSFSSPQAVKGLEILKNKYDYTELFQGVTYLVEIIYPDNKIVVDYGKQEKLVMLGAFITHAGTDVPLETVALEAKSIYMPMANRYTYTIEEMIALQQTMPKDQEGFVVRFDNGLRVKIKGREYMRIAKMIAEMSPISFWESMTNGLANREYLQQLPEEFRVEFEPIVEALEAQYKRVMLEIQTDFCHLPTQNTDKAGLKEVGLFVQSNTHSLTHPGAMFSRLLNKPEALDKYIMKYIRPTGNILKE
jgi:RNA ligase